MGTTEQEMSLEAVSEIEKVRVFVRVRPLNTREDSHKCINVVDVNRDENAVGLTNPQMSKLQRKEFRFDHIFHEGGSQTELYQKVALPIVEQIFRGYNGTIFTYGQTGSGKTYTMMGSDRQTGTKGIIPNTFSHVFSRISRASGEKSFAVTATYIEIYNEEVRDLLAAHPNQRLELGERLDVGVYIKGLTGFTVDSIESINELMQIGNKNRTTRCTLMNNLSSRSHAIFTLAIETKDGNNNQTTAAKLNLVDLAGSERVNRSGATGIGLREASNINQSLFVLSNVISALVEEKATHVPYRNSKLTRLLQDSLGGNSKTAMIATISSAAVDYDETLCTLRYASRAKLIKNRVHLNVQSTKGLIEQFEREIFELQKRFNIIGMKAEAKRLTIVNKGNLEEDSFEKRKQQYDDFLSMEASKNELKIKIACIQNKILIGGKTLFDMAEEQRFLLESSFEEIENLDRSHQELQEKLEEKEIEQIDLREQFCSVQEEDEILDEKIKKLEIILGRVGESLDEQRQEQAQELNLLLEHSQTLSRELQLTNLTIVHSIPKQLLRKVELNLLWNSDTCDFQVNGIAHIGNNMKKRRFQKHIPKSALMGIMFNQRKNILRTSAHHCLHHQHSVKKAYFRYSSRNEHQ